MEQVMVILTSIGNAFGAFYHFIQTTPFFSKNLFNFILVIVFFIWLFKKIDFIGILENKKQEILASIKKSEDNKSNATEHLEKTTNALKNVDEDIKKIVVDAKNIAKTITDSSREKLNEEIGNLEKRAENIKTGYLKKAHNEVSENVANASVSIAKYYLDNSLDEATHKELIYNFINDLENMRVE